MKVCVIGGGAAGCMAAIMLARGGAEVDLLEKNEKIGKKIYITGKGRCNLTNDCEPVDFLRNVVRGEKFLRSSIYAFTPADTMEFFEGAGLPLVVERGNRVYPASQKSSDVIKTLAKELTKSGVRAKYLCEVEKISPKEGGFEVSFAGGKEFYNKVVVATGGLSYPSTGSTGDGYEFARSFGHEIVETHQALVPIQTAENVSSLEGIALKNVSLSAITKDGKKVCEEFGELMFTDRGLSGPIALTISSYINRLSGTTLSLDLKPALDDKTLDARLLRDFEARQNQDLKNVSRALLPDRLNLYVLKRAGVSADKKVNVVTKQERASLVHTLKHLTFRVSGLAPYTQAVITSGGVDLKELTPACESKNQSGLYFVGETIDVDALTGGFNLQIAFATGVAAARNILKQT